MINFDYTKIGIVLNGIAEEPQTSTKKNKRGDGIQPLDQVKSSHELKAVDLDRNVCGIGPGRVCSESVGG